jgi:F-type H+-transporting ATPase subunit epsilon
MASIRLDIVTAERSVFSEDVDIVIAPGADGELGILPHHTPLMTALKPGEIIARKGTDEYSLVVSGGFLEVRPDRVIILADAAERAGRTGGGDRHRPCRGSQAPSGAADD